MCRVVQRQPSRRTRARRNTGSPPAVFATEERKADESQEFAEVVETEERIDSRAAPRSDDHRQQPAPALEGPPGITPQGTYLPSASKVRDQVETYERSGGQEANTFTGVPVITVTMRGNKSGSIRKEALMRVEHDREYALVASKVGALANPVWY
jgi:hypothetical protein